MRDAAMRATAALRYFYCYAMPLLRDAFSAVLTDMFIARRYAHSVKGKMLRALRALLQAVTLMLLVCRRRAAATRHYGLPPRRYAPACRRPRKALRCCRLFAATLPLRCAAMRRLIATSLIRYTPCLRQRAARAFRRHADY